MCRRLPRRNGTVVTTGAGPRNAAMVHARFGPAIGIMASIARRGRGDMGGRPARGYRPVMAFGACPADRCVVDTLHRVPRAGRMTAGTCIGRTDMVRRLTRDSRPVMATNTSSGQRTMVYGSHMSERGGRVACFATLAAADMVGGLCQGRHSASRAMATRTRLGNILKTITYVATFTIQPLVSAI